MKTTEIRVRPVIRHAVTRFTQEERGASSECMGEFSHESYAEEVADALRAQHAPQQYVAVERGFQYETNAVYFDSERAVMDFVDRARAQEREFRVFSRALTDPMAKARVECGFSEPLPDVPPRLWHDTSASPEEMLADIPNLLRSIAAKIDAGEIKPLAGVVTLRVSGKSRPEVFGLGSKVDPYAELRNAAKEIDRLAV